MGVSYFFVESGPDDGYATSGGYYSNTGSWVIAGLWSDSTTQNTFHLISNVNIPPKAVIKSATLVCFVYIVAGKTANLKISAEKALNPSACTGNADYFSRTLTDNKVDWDISGELFSWQSSPDISDMISEIILQDGWAAGNAIQMFIRDDGSALDNYMETPAYDYDDSSDYTPYLRIEWEMPHFGIDIQIPEIGYSVNDGIDSFNKFISIPPPVVQCNASIVCPPINVALSLPNVDVGGNKEIVCPSININLNMNHLAYAGQYSPSITVNSEIPVPSLIYDYVFDAMKVDVGLSLPVPLVKVSEHLDIIPYNYLDVVIFNTLETIFYNDAIRESSSIVNSWVVLYDSNEVPDVILDSVQNVIIHEEVNGILTLEFTLPFNDVNVSKVVNERKIRVRGKDFYIKNIVTTKSFGGAVQVFGEATWYELGNLTPISIFDENAGYVEYSWLDSSPELPMIYILKSTDWDVGIISEEILDLSRDFKVTSSMNVLECLNSVVDFWGGELEFDFVNYRVNLLSAVGTDPGVAILAGKNMKEISHEVDSSEIVTRLYLYGKDGLDISDVNDGVPFVEDYTYYSGLKVGTVTDERFTNASDLKAKAIELLAEISKESHIYTIKASDLTFLEELAHEEFNIGDYVSVYDEDLDIFIKTRVLKLDYNVSYPEDNVLELSAKSPSLEDLLAEIDIPEDTEETAVVTIDDDAITGNFEVYFNYDTVNEIYLGEIELGKTGSSFKIGRSVSNIENDVSGGDYVLDRDGEPQILCDDTVCDLTIDKFYLKYDSDNDSIMPIDNGYVILSVDGENKTLIPIEELTDDNYLENITLLSSTNNEKQVKIVFKNCLNDGAIEHALQQYSEVVKNTVFTAYSEDGVSSPLDIYVYD